MRSIEHDTEGPVAGKAYDRLRELLPAACTGSRPDILTPEEVRSMVKWSELAAYRGH